MTLPRPRLRPVSYRTQLWLMLLPFLGGTLLFVALPALLSAGLAFTAYDGLGPPTWVGFANLRTIASDPLVPIAVANTIWFVLLAVPLRVLGALLLALLLSRPRRGVGWYRSAVYLPTIIPDAAFALIWLWVFNPLYGPVNAILGGLGLGTPGWLADADTARYPFLVMSLTQVGEGFLVLLAGLRSTPRELYDAADVDGAGRLRTFRSLTLPLLAPWLLLLTVRDVIVAIQYTFAPSVLMTGGDPHYATLFLPLLIFEEAFDRLRFGIGSMLMLATFLVTGALIIGLYLVFRWRGYAGDV
ncbi:MAG: sugar ABC transporter permease [Chloroflexota bacterium]